MSDTSDDMEAGAWEYEAHLERSLRSINLQLKQRSNRKVILMNSVNKVILIGHLGKDPEVRYTAQGKPVANFSMATSERWNDRSGQKQEKSEWHNIVAWDKTAEICGQYLRKGSPVYVEGKLATQSWEDRDGTKKYKTEIVAHQVIFLAQNQGQQGYQQSQGYQQPYQAPQQGYQNPNPTYAQPDYGQQPQGDYYPQQQEAFGAPAAPPEEDLPF
jgi:single-strand DNA-binding protein